jgi:hypothetical protein
MESADLFLPQIWNRQGAGQVGASARLKTACREHPPWHPCVRISGTPVEGTTGAAVRDLRTSD